MHKPAIPTNREMAKTGTSPSSNNGPKANSRPVCPPPFPGGNWPSKVPGIKSGGNRGQGPKA